MRVRFPVYKPLASPRILQFHVIISFAFSFYLNEVPRNRQRKYRKAKKINKRENLHELPFWKEADISSPSEPWNGHQGSLCTIVKKEKAKIQFSVKYTYSIPVQMQRLRGHRGGQSPAGQGRGWAAYWDRNWRLFLSYEYCIMGNPSNLAPPPPQAP